MAPGSPRDLVRRAATAHGERVAVTWPRGSLTYRDLADRTAALAASLRRCGIGPGVQVSLALPNSVAYLVWTYGVLEAGGTAVPLATVATAWEAGRLLETAGIRFLVAHEETLLPRQMEMRRETKCGSVEGACLWRTDRVSPVELSSDILMRQFSSGSTGQPKHVLKTEVNMACDYEHFCEGMDLKGGETFLGVAPFHHSYGAMSFLAAFHVGGRVSVLPRFLPGPVIELASRDRPAVFLTTPAMIEVLGICALAPGDYQAFRSVRACVCSTGRLRRAEHDAFQTRFGVSVRVQYGSTETGSATVDLQDGFEEGRVGRPYPGVEIGIFDEDGNTCPDGQDGEIGIRSPGACDRYVGDPDNTARIFRSGWVFPGDRGRLDNSGHLHLSGRSDIINVDGYKVDRVEVETVIREALPVRDVIALEGRRGEAPAVRVIIEANPAEVTRPVVLEVCRKKLSPHKVPSQVEIHERLERDANGKVLRASLDV